MTEEQRAELEKLARNAEFKRSDFETAMEDQIKFNRAANPATVLDLLATIARLEAEKVKDGEALEPFARAADKLDGKWDDRDCRWNCPTRSGVTVAHIRAARARLSSRAKDQSQ